MRAKGTINPRGIARALNIQDGHVVRVHYGKHSSSTYGGIYADAAFFDAPVGSVRAWFYSDIPDGWRLCDGTGGTIDLRGRFLMGINTDAGAPYDENSIGDTGGYRYHGYTENQHQKVTGYASGYDNPVLTNIDPESHNTDNRPHYYVLAYIQRVEPWTRAS